MKLRTVILFIFTLTAVLLFSCSDDTTNNHYVPPVDTSSFIYPFTIGSTWNYQKTSTVTDIRPDSIRYLFSAYPLTGTGIVTILYDTTIKGITTRCILDSYSEMAATFNSRKYYIQTDSSLLMFAYRLASSSLILPDNLSNIFFTYNRKKYKSTFEFFFNLENSLQKISSDTIIIENPPVQTLKYPIQTNTQWIYRNLGSDTLYRKYIQFENLEISGQTISCIKTQLDWSQLEIDAFYDYYSKYGKIKSDFFLNDALITNEFGDTLGFADISEVSTVTSFNIIEK